MLDGVVHLRRPATKCLNVPQKSGEIVIQITGLHSFEPAVYDMIETIVTSTYITVRCKCMQNHI